MTKLYKVVDLNIAGLCSREIHLYCDQLGLDFYRFVQEGFSAQELYDIQSMFKHPEFDRFIREVVENEQR